MVVTTVPRNVIATLLQVTVTGVAFFVLYRFMYRTLGVAEIGVWSIVLASVSVSRLVDLGLSSAVVRHVAQAVGHGDERHAASVIETTAITLGVLMAIVIALLFFPLRVLLRHAVPAPALILAMSIFPFALVSLWFAFLSSVFQGALDGFQRIDLRAGVVITATCGYVVLALVLMPDHGLRGLAYAQVMQSIGSALLGWSLLRRQSRALSLLPFKWSWAVLKPLVDYGAKVQVIGLMSFVLEPSTKFFMSRFGGLESLGYYEMANKLVVQLRALIVEANRVVVPVVASSLGYTKDERQRFFELNYRVVFFISVGFYSVLAMLMPAIAMLWTGTRPPKLIYFGLMLTLGWFVNTLTGPAFFFNLGSGRLKHNLYTQTIIATVGITLGWVGGLLFGAYGVVSGSVLGLTLGAFYLLRQHMKELSLPWPRSLIPVGMPLLLTAAILVAVLINVVAIRSPPGASLKVEAVALFFWLLVLASSKIFKNTLKLVRT